MNTGVRTGEVAARRFVMLLGATGLVGQECLRLLTDDESCSRIVTLTRRPLAPAQAALKVDQHVIDFADLASFGANSKSPLFFNRLKGELEDALKAMAFRSLTIAQPSVLIGERAEPRLSEKIAWRLGFITPPQYRPVHASSVAAALVHYSKIDEPGVRVIPNRELERFGE